MPDLPRVVADGPLASVILELLDGHVELLDWRVTQNGSSQPVDAVYTYGHLPVDGDVMDRLPGLRVISNYGVGVDHIDLKAAADRGIPVGNTPGVLDGATADMGFALLLSVARRVVDGARYAHGPDFIHYDPGYMLGREVHHATLGIIGLGRIGRQVARRAAGFEMKVLYHNRRRRPELEAELGVCYATFDELLANADFLMLTVPLTPQTQGLIGAEELARMKPSAMLINIARGGVVDTGALTEALRTGRLAGAGLDVTDPEPLLRDHPLLDLPGVVIVPHLGSATEQTRRRMAEMSVENLLAGLAGKPLPTQVTL